MSLIKQVSEAGWCCALDDGNGLWYTDKYPEEMFFEHWALMAERYAANPMVIGADLRNEVRATKKGENGTVTFALWGSGRAEQDWNQAAEEAGRRVLAANPDMLVIVGGLVSGGFLTPAILAPIQLPNQVSEFLSIDSFVIHSIPGKAGLHWTYLHLHARHWRPPLASV